MMKFRILLVVLTVLSYLFIPGNVYAINNHQFITVVNPVRISSYTIDPPKSIEAQYSIIENNKLPATWLLTYDAISNNGVSSIAKTMNKNQEIGIFLEITKEFADNAKVDYHETGSWHHAASVFLSGYTQEERIKLIDTVFNKFKEVFGYYPVSVGSWWTDSYSLEYMQSKYGITGNLGVSDQYSTDGYQVWGTYWSTPYYPSKYHSGIPASSNDTKLDLIMFQWAPRDPLNGYKSSLFSTQDYFRKEVGQDIAYFEKLINLYGKVHDNDFGQITVGLEGDFNPIDYQEIYSQQMQVVKKLEDGGEFTISNMQQFSIWYKDIFKNISPDHIIETDDILGSSKKVVWYQSPRYRLGIKHDYKTNDTKLFDFRTYHKDMQEPYYQSPNRDFDLSINIHSYFDEINNKDDVWNVDTGELLQIDSRIIKFEKGEIQFSEDGFSLVGFDISLPSLLAKYPTLQINDFGNRKDVVINDDWLTPLYGATYSDLTPEATHLITTRKVRLGVLGLVVLIIAGSMWLIKKDIKKEIKYSVPVISFAILILVVYLWKKNNTTRYLITQGEIEVLQKLSVFPPGKVLVYDNECLQCEYHTNLKPAAFANKRDYVEKWSNKKVVYSSEVFDTEAKDKAKEKFDKTNAKYIYLVNFEGYQETIPFSPGDLGVEKLYKNSNAVLWSRKDKN